jgi:alpha-ribazole phosphatase
MKLFLVRHPEPRIAPGICYGRLDVPLATPVMEAAARIRPQLPPDLPVWTSPARRCRELADVLHPAPRVEERLQEMNFGAWEGQEWDAIGPEALEAWAADPSGFVPPGGESARQVQARALEFVADLEASGINAATLITHAGILRVLLAYRQKCPGKQWPLLRFAYEAVLALEFEAASGS